MNLYNNSLYCEDVRFVAELDLPWDRFEGKTVMLSGATGLIGSFLVDVLMEKCLHGLNCKIYALSRDENKFRSRFVKYTYDNRLEYVKYDANEPLTLDEIVTVDYILHLASNTHPLMYSTDPIGTITTNVFGLKNLLDFAVNHNCTRFAFASSNEMYGENRGDVELFDEDYCGYINCNTLRAGYPESKRCGEALCQAYRSQRKLDIVIPRITRSYGPTMNMSDTKALSQFIKRGLSGEDIVLKSAGTQLYSYTYVADAVSGLLTVVLRGESGEAYNIADLGGNVLLSDLAGYIADYVGTKVVFEVPDVEEAAGYSKATKALLDGTKLRNLGWFPKYDINTGIIRTMEIMK